MTEREPRLVGARFRRIWALVEHIAANPGKTRAQLSDIVFLSERQVQADLGLIRVALRLPLIRSNSYRFADDTNVRGFGGLTLHGLLELVGVMADAMRQRRSSAGRDRLRELQRQLVSMAPIHLQPLAYQLLCGPRHEMLLVLTEAILTPEQLVQVACRRGAESWQVVMRPELIFPHLDNWYVLGVDDRHRDRLVRLEQIAAVTLAEAAPVETTRVGRAS